MRSRFDATMHALIIGASSIVTTPAWAGDPPAAQLSQLAVWSTPGDGRLVMIARSSTDFVTPIPVRVRVCVTNFTGTNNTVNLLIWTTPNLWDSTQISSTPLLTVRQLQLGDCVEIDRPAALVVQDSTVSGVSSGYYQLLEPPANLPEPIGPQSNSAGKPIKHSHAIKVSGPLELAPTACLPDKQAATPISNDFSKQCKLLVPPDADRKGVRICFGQTDVARKDAPPQAYAASLIDMITNPAFAPPMNKPSPYDYNWSPVTPNGCRDVIFAKSPQTDDSGISFLIGPNSFTGNPPWVPNDVTRVTPTVYSITWTTP